ncbi:hypothetical protein BDN72DRAFT_906356 [Pluteus cervinus]|uniref:Uncharacterized protein n=1 Tax=Pluteus cervinus TaxID=181527 RepID=A0ACD3A0E6_9AGAR|nr:hypothetical protein BDN72DRAFT_906356 [Pluteus cervinus]
MGGGNKKPSSKKKRSNQHNPSADPSATSSTDTGVGPASQPEESPTETSVLGMFTLSILSSPQSCSSKNHYTLRKNRQYAGAVDVGASRRPSADVAAERERKTREHREKEKAKDAAIDSVVDIEQEMEKEDQNMRKGETTTNLPPRVHNRRPTPTFDVDRQTDDVEMEDDGRTTSSYAPDNVPDSDSEESGSVMDASGEEDVTRLKKISATTKIRKIHKPEQPKESEEEEEVEPRKKAEKKRARQAVKEKRDVAESDTKGKRKVDDESVLETVTAAKKMKKSETGLRGGWDKGKPTKTNAPPTSEDDESIGGISDASDDARAERTSLTNNRRTVTKSLAKIGPTTSVEDFIKPNTTRITLRGHVPPASLVKVQTTVYPLLRQYFGISLRPWTELPEDEVIKMYLSIIPDDKSWASGNEGHKVVVKLSADVLSQWRSKMGSNALKYMKEVIVKEPDHANNPDSLKTWCADMLSGDYKSRGFYYQTFIKAGSADVGDVKKRIFCHPLIASGLGWHLDQVSQLPPHLRKKDRPEAALILAIQAAHRAISRWSEGTYYEPPVPALQQFSADNWGDNPRRNVSDYPPKIPATIIQGTKPVSELKHVVQRLNESHWDRIMEAAKEFTKGTKKQNRNSKAEEEEVLVVAELSDFELHDDVSD